MSIKHIAIGVVVAIASLSSYAQRMGEDARIDRIDQREARQEARIREGVRSGELTRRETARLERQQSAIRSAEARAKADGYVSPREAARIDRMQDRASRSIHREKNDAQTRDSFGGGRERGFGGDNRFVRR